MDSWFFYFLAFNRVFRPPLQTMDRIGWSARSRLEEGIFDGVVFHNLKPRLLLMSLPHPNHGDTSATFFVSVLKVSPQFLHFFLSVCHRAIALLVDRTDD
jgi:hypothetical protein